MAKEIEKIIECTLIHKPFLLNGGAGSGKTHTLIELIKTIYASNPNARIACITYTNAAVQEINERAPYENLRVSTIHDFLWSHISKYNKELKKALITLFDEDKIISKNFDPESDDFQNASLKYRDFRSLSKGVISHDEVIPLAEHMFANYKLLCDVFKDSYDYVFVDEYQDTFSSVIEILIEHLKKSSKLISIGFFGDAMQSIYDKRVGSLEEYINDGEVVEIVKSDNSRNPSSVIEVANKLRYDSLVQAPVGEAWAKNYNQTGEVAFLYSQQEDFNFDNYKDTSSFLSDFDFGDAKENKALYLTIKLIAQRDGFQNIHLLYDKDPCVEIVKKIIDKFPNLPKETLLKDAITHSLEHPIKRFPKTVQTYLDSFPLINKEGGSYSLEHLNSYYSGTDKLLGESRLKVQSSTGAGKKRDPLCQQLYEITHCLDLYNSNEYNAFINKVDFKIKSIEDKRRLKEKIDELNAMHTESCLEVINKAAELGVWAKSEKYLDFEKERLYLFERIKEVGYYEYQQVYNYVEEYSIFSSQHGVKGKEYDNILVVMDNGKWNNYNYKKMFLEFDKLKDEQSGVSKRARHIFYVCCTRPKKRLVIYYQNPEQEVLVKAKEIFGENQVHLVE